MADQTERWESTQQEEWMRLKRARRLTLRCHKLAIKYAKENGMRDDLCGMCGIASSALYVALKTDGFNPILKHGKTKYIDGKRYHHVWLELDGKVLDVTYSQFDKTIGCYIGQETQYHKAFTDIEEIDTLNVFYTWENNQQPTETRIDWFMERIFPELFISI